MPDRRNHLRQAGHNEKFINHFELDSTIFLDWVVTGIFYSALHYVEAYLATKDIHLRKHKARDAYFQKLSDLKRIYRDYRTLKDDSEGARYDLQQFQPQEVHQLFTQEFNTIKNHILRLLPTP